MKSLRRLGILAVLTAAVAVAPASHGADVRRVPGTTIGRTPACIGPACRRRSDTSGGISEARKRDRDACSGDCFHRERWRSQQRVQHSGSPLRSGRASLATGADDQHEALPPGEGARSSQPSPIERRPGAARRQGQLPDRTTGFRSPARGHGDEADLDVKRVRRGRSPEPDLGRDLRPLAKADAAPVHSGEDQHVSFYSAKGCF